MSQHDNLLCVRRHVVEPGVSVFIKGHLRLFETVCFYAPGLHQTKTYRFEPYVGARRIMVYLQNGPVIAPVLRIGLIGSLRHFII